MGTQSTKITVQFILIKYAIFSDHFWSPVEATLLHRNSPWPTVSKLATLRQHHFNIHQTINSYFRRKKRNWKWSKSVNISSVVFVSLEKEICPTLGCMTKSCTKRHPKTCKFFLVQQSCKFGDQFSYRHDITSKKMTLPKLLTNLCSLKEPLKLWKKRSMIWQKKLTPSKGTLMWNLKGYHLNVIIVTTLVAQALFWNGTSQWSTRVLTITVNNVALKPSLTLN